MSLNEIDQIPGTPPLNVSLVTTVLNEADQLPEFLESIRNQDLLPSEIIIVDGGSTDGTLEVLEEWRNRLPLTVVSQPGANISTGRNIGIATASSEIIAVTDAGVTLAPDWLQHLVAPFTQTLIPVDAVGGFFVPDSRNSFEAALAATTLPDVEEIDPDAFLPSSRSFAFRRRWFEAGVRYPQWLDYCEDLLFDLRLKRAGAKFSFQPRAIVYFRPRSGVAEFWRQYYRYARGDGRAGLFWRRHAIRYLTYLVLIPSFFLSRSRLWRTLIVIGGVAYMRRPFRRLVRWECPSVPAAVPLLGLSVALRAIGDLAKMAGYPAGLWWRARRYGLRRDWRSISERLDIGDD
jgi:glycosyltransferase involved in cell wall biosynthesis